MFRLQEFVSFCTMQTRNVLYNADTQCFVQCRHAMFCTMQTRNVLFCTMQTRNARMSVSYLAHVTGQHMLCHVVNMMSFSLVSTK